MDEAARGVFDRRALLCGAAALASSPAWAQRPALRPPPALGPLPKSWFRAEVIALWPGDPPNGPFQALPVPPDAPPGFFRNISSPTLRVFRPAQANGKAMLLMPGGAYSFVVGTHEGAVVAEALARRGYTVFVLIYRLPGEGWRERWNVPLQDAQRAVRLIRANAARYGLAEGHVAALGFSAGGHLAASLATGYAEALYVARDATDGLDPRPSAVGLIYPVITLSAPFTHRQSAAALLGPAPSEALITLRSPERHVTSATPPTFLAHALDDPAVPAENTQMMLAALRAAKVRAEAHLFEEGGHGFGLGAANSPAGQWLALFALWLDRNFEPA